MRGGSPKSISCWPGQLPRLSHPSGHQPGSTLSHFRRYPAGYPARRILASRRRVTCRSPRTGIAVTDLQRLTTCTLVPRQATFARFERREARWPTPLWIVGLGGVCQLGFSITAPLVLPVALATIWPLSLIAVAYWIVGDPAGIRVLRFCIVPPLSMYGPPTITPLSLIAAGVKLPRLVMVPLL